MKTETNEQNTTLLPFPKPDRLLKWEAGATLGPRMLKQFNDTMRSVNFEAKGFKELRGIIGKPETQADPHNSRMIELCGGEPHPELAPRLLAIQHTHGHFVTSENYKALLADLEGLKAWLIANPMIRDLRITQEAHDAQQQKNAEYRAAFETKQAEKQTATDTELEATRKLYPWAKQDGSDHARGASNLKALLTRTFPGIAFRVVSESYSMGCSIRAHWQLGPTADEVEAIADKFQACDFDGMQDLEEHRDEGEGFRKWMGSAKYVFTHRGIEGIGDTVTEMLRALGGSRWVNEPHHLDSVENTARRLIGRTSFPAGAKVKAVEHNDAPTSGCGFEQFYKITFEEAQAPAPTTSPTGITVTRNEEKGGVEIRFPAKPDQATLERVKGAGFRWSRFSSCWWARASEDAVQFANTLAGAPAHQEAAS